jgi:transposase-like protein
MISSVIPARLEFSCGHAALVTLPRLKGESASQRTERVNGEKTAARSRPCDFCGPSALPPLDVHVGQTPALAGTTNGHHALETKETVMTITETPPAATEPAPKPEAAGPKTTGAAGVTRLGAEETKRTFPPRRRLGDEQEREVTRLYVETTTPVAQIGQRFGIGESSVYRIAQRNGAALRGRQPAAGAAAAAAPVMESPSAMVESPTSAAEAPAPVAAPVTPSVAPPAARPARKPRTRATPAAKATTGTTASAPAPAARRGRRRATPAPAAAPAAAPVAARAAAAAPKKAPAARTPRARSTPAAPAARAARAADSGALLRFRIRFNAETVLEAVDLRAALRQVNSLGATDVQAITREA